ncbi:unnamed protein product, partial [marine sediment metagenome]
LLAITLMEKETLDDSQIRELLGFPPGKNREDSRGEAAKSK